MAKVIFFGKKRIQHYKGIIIRADLGLHEDIAKIIEDKLPKGSKILDWGSGEGALSARLSDLGYDVTAVDIRKKDFKCSDVNFIPLDFNDAEKVRQFVAVHEGCFDAVLGVEAIEHVENPWEYVRAMKAMLKPGGLLLLSTPNTTSWLSRCIFLFSGKFHQFGDQDLEYGHINPLSPWEISVILQGCGLRKIDVIPGGTLPPVYLTKSWKLLLMNAMALLLRPWMRGVIDGWCVIATARKSD